MRRIKVTMNDGTVHDDLYTLYSVDNGSSRGHNFMFLGHGNKVIYENTGDMASIEWLPEDGPVTHTGD